LGPSRFIRPTYILNLKTLSLKLGREEMIVEKVGAGAKKFINQKIKKFVFFGGKWAYFKSSHRQECSA